MAEYTNSTGISGVNYTQAAQTIQEVNISGYQNWTTNCEGMPNSLFLAVGGPNSKAYYSSGFNSHLTLCLPVAFMGAFKNSTISPSYVNNVEVTARASTPNITAASENQLYTDLLYQYGSGFNTTGPIDKNTSNYEPTLVSLGLTGLGIAASIAGYPEVGYAIAASSAAYTIFGASTGHSQSMLNEASANSTAYEYFGVTNGSDIQRANYTFYKDVFGAGIPVLFYISQSQFGTNVTFTINATSYTGPSYAAVGYCSDAVQATHLSEQIHAVPASEISGTIYLGPGDTLPDANHYVYLLDDQTGQSYKVKTNSAGDYRFFAQPNTSYSLYATYNSPANGSSGYNPELSRNSLNFTTGSPGGLEYETMNIGGVIEGYVDRPSGPLSNAEVWVENSEGNWEFVYTSSDGNYIATIGNSSTYSLFSEDAGFVASNAHTVQGNYLGISYQNFTLSYAYYSVVFTESGLSSGTSWTVALNGTSESSISSSITFSEHMGTYTYQIGSVSGYEVSPKSGTVTVNFNSVPEGITFTGTGSVTSIMFP